MQSIVHEFANLSIWTRQGQRAPHKPLLVLHALGRLQRGLPRMQSFHETEKEIQKAFALTIPGRQTQASYPFWNLRNDGIWEVTGTEGMARRGGDKEPLLRLFRQPQVQGGFPEEIHSWLCSHPAEVVHVARGLMDAHFAPTLHSDIASFLGLSLAEPGFGPLTGPRGRRSPEFRVQVLRAYEHRCAVCGYDGRLDSTLVGLEAAHVKWHAAGGSDAVDNGVALCSIHHKLFDFGAFSLSKDYRVLVSDTFLGGQEAEFWMLRHHGQPLRNPRSDKPQIAHANREWHLSQVFRAPERPNP